MRIKRALVSVSDKTNLSEFVSSLEKLNIEIISTGGTKKYLESKSIKVKDISEFTNFPEILDGRVKTLHPNVHGGLLAIRNNENHMNQIKENNIGLIDMVVVNLYPFSDVLKKDGATHSEIIENIDIGGPSMLRSAAKNYKDVVVVTDVFDYDLIIEELKQNNDINDKLREKLAYKVFEKTSNYDLIIANYFESKTEDTITLDSEIKLNLKKKYDLRYGENPHQKAAYYKDIDTFNTERWEKLHGKELSYNNFLDIDACWHMASSFKNTTCVIVKHNNPCGIGQDENPHIAYKKALKCDPVSAFGGIVSLNTNVTEDLAREIINIFTECIIAPSFDDKALEILKTKKNLRILKIRHENKGDTLLDLKVVFDGILIQEKDINLYDNLKTVTKKNVTDDELKLLEFAWTVSKFVKSNAIVLARDMASIGIGAGQMSRIDATEIAIMKANKIGKDLKGSVLASDAFFPFADSIERIAPLGITSVIQPGGSVRDEEVIKACDKHGISMIFTGQRHFKH